MNSPFRTGYSLSPDTDDAVQRLAATTAEVLGAPEAAVFLVNEAGELRPSHGAPSFAVDAHLVLSSPEPVAAGAYAGARILAADGAPMGALCVGGEAREWSERDLRFVRTMADAVSAQLEVARLRVAREHLEATLDHMPSAAWLKDRESRYLTMNRAGAVLRGHTPAELVGKTDAELFPPEVARVFVEADRRAMELGTFHAGEQEVSAVDGGRTWDVVKIAWRTAAGEVAGTVGIAHDVTERKRVERALRESEEQFRQIAENIREIFWMFDATFTQPIYISPAFEELWGRPVETVYREPHSFLTSVHPDDAAGVAQAMAQVSRGVASRIEYRLVRDDGSLRWVWSRGFPVYNADGQVYRIVGTTEDITDRKQAEQERRQAEARYRRLVENAPDVVYELDAAGRFTELNQAAAELLGRDPAELIGRSFVEIVDPADLPKGRESLRRKLEGEASTTDLELRLVHASGERRLVQVRASPVMEDGRIAGTHGIVRDITEERARDRTMRLLNAAVASYKEGVSLTDQDFNLIYANAAYCRMLGIGPDEWTTLDIPSLVPDDRERERVGEIREALAGRGAWSGRIWRRRASDGKVIPLDMMAGAVYSPDGERNLFFIFHEAADTIEREVRLRRAERLASVGTLIGGVAHELNNPLHAIRNFADLMLMEPRRADDLEALEVMRREADRAAKVVADLRLIARETQQPGGERTAVDLNDVVRHVLRVRRYSLATGNVAVSEDLAEGLPPVLGSRGELEQVVLNLVVNAEQAMQAGERRLVLRTRRTAAGASVHVADSGRGIPPEHLERIFDPFFTTKAPGEGTGLGLSLVHSIVAEHRGEIHVESEPGKGTTFCVDLPLAPGEQAQASRAESPSPASASRRVLVVDDEDAIRRVTVRLLKRMGHHADAAADGAEALRLLDAGDYDVILSDLRMPGLGGEELLHLLRARGGGLERRLVFVTGDAATSQAGRVALEANVPVLVKPVSVDELARAVEYASKAAADG